MKKLTQQEELTKQTYNKLAVEWAAAHNTKTFWLEEMQQFHTLLPKGKILEIGSGGGRDAQELVGYGYEYIGTDFSRRLIEEARKNNPGLTFREVSVYDLDFDELFDGFWCAAVLLHIPKARISAALRAIIKNMKVGAIGFISIKEGQGQGVEARQGSKGYDRLFAYWHKADFRKVLTREGLEIIMEGQKPYKDSIWLTFTVRVRE